MSIDGLHGSIGQDLCNLQPGPFQVPSVRVLATETMNRHAVSGTVGLDGEEDGLRFGLAEFAGLDGDGPGGEDALGSGIPVPPSCLALPLVGMGGKMGRERRRGRAGAGRRRGEEPGVGGGREGGQEAVVVGWQSVVVVVVMMMVVVRVRRVDVGRRRRRRRGREGGRGVVVVGVGGHDTDGERGRRGRNGEGLQNHGACLVRLRLLGVLVLSFVAAVVAVVVFGVAGPLRFGAGQGLAHPPWLCCMCVCVVCVVRGCVRLVCGVGWHVCLT